MAKIWTRAFYANATMIRRLDTFLVHAYIESIPVRFFNAPICKHFCLSFGFMGLLAMVITTWKYLA